MINLSRRGILFTCVLASVILISSNHELTVSALERTWNVYRLTLDKLTFDLGRGETIELQVEVEPPDQPISFFTSQPDGRVVVTMGQASGRFRSVSIRDLTSEGDGSANFPSSIEIEARLPDGAVAKTAAGEDIKCISTLVMPFYERLLCPDCELQKLTDQIPAFTHTLIQDQVRTGLVQASQKYLNQPPPGVLLDSIADHIDPEVVDISNETGLRMGAEAEIAVKNSNPTEAFSLVRRDAPPLVPIGNTNKLDVTVSPSIGGFELRFLDGSGSGQQYTFDQFIKARPTNITRSQIIVTQANANLNATLKTADLNMRIELLYGLENVAGGNLNPLDRNKVSASIKYTFGAPGE